MWFKNARLYNVDFSELKSFIDDPAALEDAVENASFRPCTAQEVQSIGFSPLFGRDGAYTFQSQGSIFLKLTEENKLLPSSVVRDELEALVIKKEAELQREIKKSERETLKTALMNQLLSRAFSTHREVLIWLHPGTNMCAVSATSAKRAESALAMLREAFGTFPATALQPRCVVDQILTEWLTDTDRPQEFELGTDTVLKSEDDGGAVIRVSKGDLTSDEISVHVEAQKHVSELQLIYNDSLSLVLCSDLSLKRLKPTDQYLERTLPEKSDDAAADLQALLLIQGDLLDELSLKIMSVFKCDSPEKA